MTRHFPLFAGAILLAAACATTSPSPPEVTSDQLNRYLIDPRPAVAGTTPRATTRSFEKAWLAYQQGRLAEAERNYAEILERDRNYVPAILGQAAISLTRGDFDPAQHLMDRAAELEPESVVVKMYRAELARARGDLRAAWAAYQEIATVPGAPAAARQRLEETRVVLFEQLFVHANSVADPDASIAILREALQVNDSDTARRVLVRKLLQTRQFEEARSEMQPLLASGKAEDPEVQELWAEIDAGMGLYQEAIARYERLVRGSGTSQHRERLDQIKREWVQANMPPQQRLALDSSALTRADLAVLIYWSIPDVRFAHNLPEPPIAIDIEDVSAREELVRAMSFRFFMPDPLTHRVEPYRLVTASNLVRILARVAMLRGIPACASPALQEVNEMLRAERILAACGVPVSQIATDPDGLISGRDAERALAQIASVLKSTEQRQARQ